MATYADFQSLESSEKIALVIIEASRRIMGWVNHTGIGLPSPYIYKVTDFDHILTTVLQDGILLASVSSIGAITAGTYFNDRDANILYLHTTDSEDPNTKFIAITFQNFFSNVGGVHQSYDLSTGPMVHWLPYVISTSEFGVSLDNKEFLGFALEGSGSVKFINDQNYWADKYDKWYWDNQNVFVYSWNRELPITEAKLIFKGLSQARTWNTKQITFKMRDRLKALRQPLALDPITDVSGAVVLPSLEDQLQRVIYGRVTGHIPTNIDHTLPNGNAITGTVTTAGGSTTITGSGTQFLKELSPDDELIFGIDETKFTVASIASDTSLTLTENFVGTAGSGLAALLIPSHPKKYQNRVHLIAGHQLREPSTTVVLALDLSHFEVVDDTDFFVGSEVVVGSFRTFITRVNNNVIRVLPAMPVAPSPSTTVTLSSVWDVYLNDRKLNLTRDYSYSSTTSKITLTELAEFNVAPVLATQGTLTFTNTSRTVSGSGTVFKTEFKPGNWVRSSQESDWFEILSITSDTSMLLRTACTYNRTTTAFRRQPDVYKYGDVILTCDAMGATEDGTPSGTFIGTGPLAAKDILIRSGLTDEITTSTFNESSAIANNIINMAVPVDVEDTESDSIRDLIALINQSIFGSLYQSADFKLEYKVIDPSRPDDFTQFIEADVIKFTVKSDSTRLVKNVVIEYLVKEFDPSSLTRSFKLKTVSSEVGEYLGKTGDEFRTRTVLRAEQDALVYAQRWAFLREVASALVNFETSLQGSRLQTHDRIKFIHEKIYERISSTVKEKFAGISGVSRDFSKSKIEIDDIGNSFNRCCTITENDAFVWNSSNDSQKLLNGYITDNNGMIDNDADTFSINVIW
jgi:hypothetical protein